MVILFLAHFYFPASGRASLDHRCRLFLPPRYCLHVFGAHRVQHPLIVDITSSVANLRSRAFRKSISAQEKAPQKYIRVRTRGIRTHEIDLYQARGKPDSPPWQRVIESRSPRWSIGVTLLYYEIALVLQFINHRVVSFVDYIYLQGNTGRKGSTNNC